MVAARLEKVIAASCCHIYGMKQTKKQDLSQKMKYTY